eukprot:scaffold434_cov186-Pinguiococcus_pyrenoidosus.AAC.80
MVAGQADSQGHRCVAAVQTHHGGRTAREGPSRVACSSSSAPHELVPLKSHVAILSQEAKIHQYCEAHRQARAAGTPIRVVDDVAASLGQAKPPKRVHFGDPAPTTQTLEAPSERGSEARGGPVGLAATLAARPRGADLPLQPEQEGSIVPEQVKAVDEQDDKLAEDLAATTAPTVPESALAATLKRPMRLGAEFQLPLSATLGTRKPRPSPRPSEEAIFEYVFRGKTSSERGGPGGVRRSPII